MPDIHQYAIPYYTSIEFNSSDGASDYDVAANQAAFTTKFSPTLPYGYANKITIRTNFTISVKLNSASYDAITISSTDSPFTFTGTEIHNVYISNSSGSTAAVKILLSKVSG